MSIETMNGAVKKTKKIIPFGERIVCKRRPVGKTLGSGILIAADETADRLTEIADVVALPEMTFADKILLENAEEIITSLSEMAKDGDAGALNSLMSFNSFLRVKTLKVGDTIMVGKYTGLDFNIGETGEMLSITDYDGIRGLIVESK